MIGLVNGVGIMPCGVKLTAAPLDMTSVVPPASSAALQYAVRNRADVHLLLCPDIRCCAASLETGWRTPCGEGLVDFWDYCAHLRECPAHVCQRSWQKDALK